MSSFDDTRHVNRRDSASGLENKIDECFNHVTVSGSDLVLSNTDSNISASVGLPSGGSSVFTAHNSVNVTNNTIEFGLSTGGTQSETLFPSAWLSQVPASIKGIEVDNGQIKVKRQDDVLIGSIPYADPADVADLQNDLADTNTNIEEKCLKTIQMRDGVLKGKRVDGSFSGSVDVVLHSTLDTAVSALNYVKNTTSNLTNYLLTADFASTLATYTSTGSLMPLAVLSDITSALSSYYDQTESDARYVQQSDLTSSYYDQTQSDARYVEQTDLGGFGYMTQTTTSSWTGTGTTTLSTVVHNKEPSCNWSKRVGLRANKPYAQANVEANGIGEFIFTDTDDLSTSGGHHFDSTTERLSVPRIPQILQPTSADLPGALECFNHHFDVNCKDFHMNFNITKWTSAQITSNWRWNDGETRLVIFCSPTAPAQGATEWLEAAPGSYRFDYPQLATPRKGIHIKFETNDASWPNHATYGGQVKKLRVGHYSGTTWNSWATSGSASNGVGLPDAKSYDITIQAKNNRLFVRVQPLGQPWSPADPAVTEFGADATSLFTFNMPSEFGTTDMDAADTANLIYYTSGANIMLTTNQNIELSHFKILSDRKLPLSELQNDLAGKVDQSDYYDDGFGGGGHDYNDYWINKARYLALNVGPIASATWIQQNHNGIRGTSPYNNPALFHSTLGRTITNRFNITSYEIIHYEYGPQVGKGARHNLSPDLRWIQIQFFFADALGHDVGPLGGGVDKQSTRPNDYAVMITEVLPTGTAPTSDGSNPNNLDYVAQNTDGSVLKPMWSASQNGINNVNRYNQRMLQNQTGRIVNYISHSKTSESFVLSICYDDDTYNQDGAGYPGNNGINQPNMEFGFNIVVMPM